MSFEYEGAKHTAKFADLLGKVVTSSTKKNLEMRVDAKKTAQPPAKPTKKPILNAILTLSTKCQG